MKQLISATLSEGAAIVYNGWEKQQKSKILSELIVKEDVNRKLVLDQAEDIKDMRVAISKAMIALHLKDPQHPLCRELNEMLAGTIYYQYWN